MISLISRNQNKFLRELIQNLISDSFMDKQNFGIILALITAVISGFSIPLNSGDKHDKQLEVGKSYKILLAHGPEGADDFSTHHQKRTLLKITLSKNGG